MSSQQSLATQHRGASEAADGPQQDAQDDRILCNHCRRTASNGIRCLGMCVADNDY